MEDNYNNKLCQKVTKKALYYKNDAALYILFYGQLHSDIVTAAKNSTVLLFGTVQKYCYVVGLLPILRSICVKLLSRSKVDPNLEQLKLLSTTLSYALTKGISNQDLGDSVYDQVLATQSQCGVFVFGDNYDTKVLINDGNQTLKDDFSFD